MQNVNFKSLEAFFEFIPAAELKIVEVLRKLIFECIPDCEEKLTFNVPFYKRHSNICYIWPPSITWGATSHHGVHLGFINGNLLQDEIRFLSRGKRKQVFWKAFFDIKEIDANLIRAYLHEAVLIDNEKAKMKSKPKKKIKRSLS